MKQTKKVSLLQSNNQPKTKDLHESVHTVTWTTFIHLLYDWLSLGLEIATFTRQFGERCAQRLQCGVALSLYLKDWEAICVFFINSFFHTTLQITFFIDFWQFVKQTQLELCVVPVNVRFIIWMVFQVTDQSSYIVLSSWIWEILSRYIGTLATICIQHHRF
jgi:hypothetical protein